MSKTADHIIDVMAELIQSRGYSAVSYQDISEAVGIRKASIHYHFPSKADLGVAVIKRYRQAMMDMLDSATDSASNSMTDILDAYFEPYLSFRGENRKVCLCGALAGEYFALPDGMQNEVSGFFAAQQGWLTARLEEGQKAGNLKVIGTAEKTARLYFDALQGALLAKRTLGDDSQINDVVETLKALVR